MFRTLLLAAIAIGATTLAATPASAAVDAQVIIQPRIVIGNPQPVVERRVVVERERPVVHERVIVERRPVVRERVIIVDKHPQSKYKKGRHEHRGHGRDHRGHGYDRHDQVERVVVIRR